MKKTDAWMPLYIGDYLADTSRLTTEQHGAYLLLLMDYWRNGSPPDDETVLASITKLAVPQWRKHAPVLRGFFSVVDSRWLQKRAEEERQEATEISGKRSAAGKEGASGKWGSGADAAKTRSQRLAEARAKGTHTADEWEALQWATGYRCVCCGVAAAELEGGRLTKDHITPIYQGGDDSIENIQPECRNCNSRKGNDCQDHRETSSPGWRKRMAERLANASQTSAPSPSPSLPSVEKAARRRATAFDAAGIELPPWLDRGLWAEWVADRSERRKPITERAAVQQLSALAEYRNAGQTPERVIRHAIASGNQGLYPPPKVAATNGNHPTETAFQRERRERVAEMTGGLVSRKPPTANPEPETIDAVPAAARLG